MQRLSWLVSVLLCLAAEAFAGEINANVTSMFREREVSLPSTSRMVICHGFGCAFHTDIGLSHGDHGRMAELMAPGKASATAERVASTAMGSSGVAASIAFIAGLGGAVQIATQGRLGDRIGSLEALTCAVVVGAILALIALLLWRRSLDGLREGFAGPKWMLLGGLLRHHAIAAPISRLLITEGPHNTAVIRDKRTGQHWTVDPWTHKGSEVPDIWPVEKWGIGG